MDGWNNREETSEPRRPESEADVRPGGRSPAAYYTLADQHFLLHLARQALQWVTTRGVLPDVVPSQLPVQLTEPKPCFITLTKSGRLRGCVGHIHAQEALYRAVMDNTRNAAQRDSRFEPVQSGELDQLAIEISVLTEPEPMAFTSPERLLDQLRPHTDGVVLRLGSGQSATFLPQVWEQLPDKEEFLGRLALKAGGAPGDWRRPGAQVSTFQIVSFKESAGLCAP
jgi:AmmeMemoRadiSam system protein A